MAADPCLSRSLRRALCRRAQPRCPPHQLRTSPAEPAQQPVTRLWREELEAPRTWEVSPACSPRARWLRAHQRLKLHVAGHDRSASHPSDSLARPILPPESTSTDHEAAWHGLPADLSPPGSPRSYPPLPPKLRQDEPTKAPAVIRAEDQACLERSHTRKSRLGVGPVVHRPFFSCFTVFQTRTLGWFGVFSCLLHRQEAGRRGNWRQEGKLPFRRRPRHVWWCGHRELGRVAP